MANSDPNQLKGDSRREFASKLGRFAAITPPALTLLLDTSMNSDAIAASAKCNNGVGNGLDCQPPGNPPINDGPGTGPGNPGNKGGPT
jgi:hypothetical protein